MWIQTNTKKTNTNLHTALAKDKSCVLILDNVDHYVDVAEAKFVLGVGQLVQEALRVKHNILIVLTCRPHINYADPRFLEIHLRGLDLAQTIELFRLRNIKVDDGGMPNLISEIWRLTEGHLLWLNLIAVQISRNLGSASVMLAELRKADIDHQGHSLFKAIWGGLAEDGKNVLRTMAEVSYPETINTIATFVKPLIKNFNQFNQAFKGLRSVGLIVERGANKEGSKFDLHPMVRSFIRTEYPTRQQRIKFIQPILIFINDLTRGVLVPSATTPPELLDRWITRAELELTSQDEVTALKTLSAADDQLIAQGRHEEFFRIAKLILDTPDWASNEMQDTEEFHFVVSNLIHTLGENGREHEGRNFLDRYEKSITSTGVAYLRLCREKCYFEWILGNFDTSIMWGEKGADLKRTSNIDTKVDFGNTLALALRDSGREEDALKILAPSQDIAEILKDDHRTSRKDSSFYGNIGRCLQRMGQSTNALMCYVKSADLLEEKHEFNDILNKGYASYWIGDVLESLNEFNLAYLFFRRAISIWTKRAPLRLAEPEEKMQKILPLVDENFKSLSDTTIDHRCREWVKSQLNRKA